MPTYGYAGKILRVDLSSGNIAKVSTLDYADRFLGGRGIATKVYWDEVLPEVSAFDAENRLILANGPLCGLPAIAGSRWEVCGKSPTTPEQFSYGNLGGRWGAELKFAGYDGIIIKGAADSPKYLLIDGGDVELRDASFVWGKKVSETQKMICRDTACRVSTGGSGASPNRHTFARAGS